ncbi:MAG: hypothetical protein J6Z49_01680 [Kiritimatiellae bacterium]|nr:hypothetical protein [Kiritimatiellia bacterium]
MDMMHGRVFRLTSALVACLLLPGLFLTGCGKKENPETPVSAQDAEAERQKIQGEVDEIFQKIAEAAQEKKYAEALKLVDGNEKKARYGEFHGRFFLVRIALLLESGETGKACDTALAQWNSDAESARGAFRSIYRFLQGREDREGMSAWTKRLSDPASKMPTDVLAEVAAWRFDAALKASDAAAAAAVVTDLFDRLSDDQRPVLIEQYLNQCLSAEKFELFQTSLETFDANPKFQTDTFKMCFAKLRLRAVLEQKKWEDAPQAIEACRVILPDNELYSLLNKTFQQLRKLGQAALIETLAGAVYKAETEKTASMNYAARIWLGSCLPNRRDEIPARLAELQAQGKVSPIELGFLFERYFYELHDRPEGLSKMCEIGEGILHRTDDTNTLSAISLKLLDGAFMLDRLSKAVEMLEKGIPGKDATWHAMTLPKVKGHAALAAAAKCTDPEEKKKSTLAAIESFKQFMDVLKAKEEQDDEFDPTTGIAYSREWILGRNADRIAKLYADVGDSAGVEAMRKTAKGFYETALKKAENEAAALELLRKEVAPYGLKVPESADGARK